MQVVEVLTVISNIDYIPPSNIDRVVPRIHVSSHDVGRKRPQ
jgi:hypothetical protein